MSQKTREDKIMTKSEIIKNLVDESISPRWEGSKAQSERNALEKELKKQTKAELLKELGIVRNEN